MNRTLQSSDVTRTQKRVRGKEMETNLEVREIPGERWTAPNKVKK